MWFQEKLFGVIIGPLWIFPTLGFLLLSWVPGLAGHLGEYWGLPVEFQGLNPRWVWGGGFPLLWGAPVGSQHSGSLLFPLIQRPASYHLCLVLPARQLLLLKSPLSARRSTEYSCWSKPTSLEAGVTTACITTDQEMSPGRQETLTCHMATQWWSSHTLAPECLPALTWYADA